MTGALIVTGIVSVVLHWTSPVEPVAQRVMQWTPLTIATFLLIHLQTAALIAALLGACAVLMFLWRHLRSCPRR